MKCLNYERLISYQNQLLQEIEQHQVQQHLLSCKRCQKMLKEYEEIHKPLKRTSYYRFPSDSANCYEEEDLLSFLEGGMKRKAQKDLCALNPLSLMFG